MKKLALVASLAIVTAAFTACGPSAPSANLKTDVDTLSYALGVANTQGLKDYLQNRMGVDTAYISDFIKGVLEGANAADDKKKDAYMAGLQIGKQLSTQMLKSINYQAFGEDSTKQISLQNFMSGFITVVEGKKALMTVEEGDSIANVKMEQFRNEKLLNEYGDNKEAGEAFLAENATKEGVIVLESGVQYKVLKAGRGPIPTEKQTVKVHYEGRLIDGTVFDSSYNRNEPMKISCSDGIKGWNEALTMMPVGSTWEVYIPQELAYGANPRGGIIKPYSALMFKIELLGIEK